MTLDPGDDLVGKARVAQRLGRSTMSVDRWTKSGKLAQPACYIGGRPMWRLRDVIALEEKFIREGRPAPTPQPQRGTS